MLSILLSLAVCLAAPETPSVPSVSAAPNGDASAPEKKTKKAKPQKIELSDTVSGRSVKVLAKDKVTNHRPSYRGEFAGKYPKRVYDGARWLHTSADFVWACWRVMDGLYNRDYRKLHGVLEEVRTEFPGTGVAPVGKALMWQVLMLENFDFRYEIQYDTAFELAKEELRESMSVPGNDAWEHFLLGAIVGVNSIHELRKENFLSAINQGLVAISHIEQAKSMAPLFVDADLGDGLWLYWRSLIASNVPGIPGFKDERVKGIELMQKAEREAVFLRPAASFSLVYTWIEERRLHFASQTSEYLRQEYPRNVINLQVLGRVQMYRKKYPDSEQSFLKVLEVSPKNQRTHYYLARLYMKMKDYARAEYAIRKYLKFDSSAIHKAYGYLFKGHIMYRQKKWKEAAASYDKAASLHDIKSAPALAEKSRKKIK